jgi:hypothetical protein
MNNQLTPEWLDEDSELESFTLVESRKKKKQRVKLENLAKNLELRRSKRTNPSVYRRSREQENPITPHGSPINTKKK